MWNSSSQNIYQNEDEVNKSLRQSILCLKQPLTEKKEKVTGQVLLAFHCPFLLYSLTQTHLVQEIPEKGCRRVTWKKRPMSKEMGRLMKETRHWAVVTPCEGQRQTRETQ